MTSNITLSVVYAESRVFDGATLSYILLLVIILNVVALFNALARIGAAISLSL